MASGRPNRLAKRKSSRAPLDVTYFGTSRVAGTVIVNGLSYSSAYRFVFAFQKRGSTLIQC
jgi:hypothetical protein